MKVEPRSPLPVGARLAVGFLRLGELALAAMQVFGLVVGLALVAAVAGNGFAPVFAWELLGMNLVYLLTMGFVFAAFRGCDLLAAQMVSAWDGSGGGSAGARPRVVLGELLRYVFALGAAIFLLQAFLGGCVGFQTESGWSVVGLAVGWALPGVGFCWGWRRLSGYGRGNGGPRR